MSEREQHTFMDNCFAYDDLLRKNGHIIGGAPKLSERNHPKMEERQGVDHRWPVCGDEGTVGRIRRAGSHRLEPCHSVDVQASGCEGRPLRDSPGGGLDRTDS